MNLQNWRRKRGVILSSKGLNTLIEARRRSEEKENFGNRYTLEEISERSGLYSGTISKVINQEGAVDKKSIEEIFKVFGVKSDASDYVKSNTRINWGEAICASVFYGRTEEMITLEKWVLHERCRLVAILGLGGIGKTALSVKFSQHIQDNFEYIIWCSLGEAPPIKTILGNLIQFLSDGQEAEANLSEAVGNRISRLIDYLRSKRCLLILDNVESVLSSGTRAGQYKNGYEEYGELFRRVGEVNHISCLILTSREKPKEVALLEGQGLPVRSLQSGGLKVESGLEIFKVKGLIGSENELGAVVERYAGNPLALKIVATTIQNTFNGNVSEFLQQDTAVFGDISDVLEQQFERLSDLEQEIIYWLAVNREPIAFSELQKDIASSILQPKLLEALESLGRRSLVDNSKSLLTLQPVVMEYVTNRFIDHVCEEIVTGKIQLLRSHALIKVQEKDYIKDLQTCIIIQSILERLFANLGGKQGIEKQLIQILTKLQKTSPTESGYTASNIINLLRQHGTDLKSYDFSNLTVWEANLFQLSYASISSQ
jgi:NB-ARC domain